MATQVVPDTPIFREKCQRFSAVPICRTCAEQHRVGAGSLLPFLQHFRCEVAQCENTASFLVIC